MNWGIIGAGNIAQRFCVSLKNEKDSVLYAISGRNREKLESFSVKNPCKKIYIDYEEMLSDHEIDIVYLALPNSMHFEYAQKALMAKKAVLCEKPAVLSGKEMREIADTARENRTLFMEAMKPRFTPLYKELKQELNSGLIGKIRNIDTHIFFLRPNTPSHLDPIQGGIIADSGIYCASWYEDFCKGARVRRSYVTTYQGSSVYVRSEIDHNEAVCSVLEAGFDARRSSQATIFGDEGYVVIDDSHRPQKAFVCLNDKEVYTIERPYIYDDFYGEIHAMIECVKNGICDCQIMSLDASIGCHDLLDQIRESIV